MSSILTSFLQIAGAKSFSDFLRGDRKKTPKKRNRSLKRSLTQRTKSKRNNKTSRRNKTIRVRNLSKRKFIGKPGKYKCVNGCNKNTSYGHFKGNEPSPKGLGYCAHCTPLNVIIKGKDGDLWQNKKYSRGKRWVKL